VTTTPRLLLAVKATPAGWLLAGSTAAGGDFDSWTIGVTQRIAPWPIP